MSTEALKSAQEALSEAERDTIAGHSAKILEAVRAWGDNKVHIYELAMRIERELGALMRQAALSTTRSDREDAERKLAAFGAWAAREFRDSLADVDGGSAQDEMERVGVIVKRTVTEPCGEGCICVEYGEFPHDCFVFPPEVEECLAAIDTARNSPGEAG